jgi:hypothetical protein
MLTTYLYVMQGTKPIGQRTGTQKQVDCNPQGRFRGSWNDYRLFVALLICLGERLQRAPTSAVSL